MKQASNKQKSWCTSQNFPAQFQTSQNSGLSITPPASGIDMADNSILQRMPAPENKTGLPDNLKAGIEALSGCAMNDVKVHYNSSKPAQFQAFAYTQGTNIHVASGQERHLPHEAWHVVQQKQGRVQPTIKMKGKVNINDDEGLEYEADMMGKKSLQLIASRTIEDLASNSISKGHTEDTQSPVQRLMKKLGRNGRIGQLANQNSIQLKNHNLGIENKLQYGRPPNSQQIIQRAPIPDQNGQFVDHEFPSVKLIKLEAPYRSNTYQIISPGVYQGFKVRFSEPSYFELDSDFWEDTTKKVSLLKHIEHDQNALNAVKELKDIGQPGRGVLAGYAGQVTLETYGLNDCVGWLLYNAEAAYMEHILVTAGTDVDTQLLKQRVTAAAQIFQDVTKTQATSLKIQLEASHYDKGKLPYWIYALIPPGIKHEINVGDGKLTHIVQPGRHERKIWECEPILFKTRQMKELEQLETILDQFKKSKSADGKLNDEINYEQSLDFLYETIDDFKDNNCTFDEAIGALHDVIATSDKRKKVMSLYMEIEKDLPGYEGLVQDMPKGNYKKAAEEYYAFGVRFFESANLQDLDEADLDEAWNILSVAHRQLKLAQDKVYEERIEKDRAARYGSTTYGN